MNIKKIASILSVLAVFTLVANSAFAIESQTFRGYTYNTWGESVPAPSGYYASNILKGEDLGTTPFKSSQDLFVSKDTLYVLDTGNNRILAIDKDFKLIKELKEFKGSNGEILTLKNPQGMYVRDNDIYIADTENSRILKTDLDGKILKIYGKPSSDIIPRNIIYNPKNIIVDRQKNMYVNSANVYEGLLVFSEEGKFLNFYGAAKVNLTFDVIATYFWKSILSKAQQGQMQRIIPTELTGAFIDKEDFIYTTKLASGSSGKTTDEIQKLNPLGVNILRFNQRETGASGGAVYPRNNYGDVEEEWYKGKRYDSILSDIVVDDKGIISAIDIEKGKVFQYDQESNLLFIFGSLGDQKGCFKKPSAIEKMGENYLVMDSQKNCITVFSPTEYAKLFIEAVGLYNEGLFNEAQKPFNEVLKINNMNTLAHKSIGKSLLEQKKYEEALYHLELGQDRDAYSIAFNEYRKSFIRKNFLLIVLGIVILLVLFIMLLRIIQKKLGITRVKTKLNFK